MIRFLGVCLGSASLTLLALAALLRATPWLLHLLRRGLRGLLILSFRLYRLLLSPLAPMVREMAQVDITIGVGRVVACILLSLLFGLALVLLVGQPVTGWSVGLSLAHGLALGLAWEEIESPGGLQLGVKVE